MNVTLAELVDRTLDALQAPAETAATVVMPDALTASATTTSFTATSVDINATDLIELESEVVYVSDVTDDPIPVVTIVRGYAGSTAVAHDAGTVGAVNPQWYRFRAAREVRNAFTYMEGQGLPYVVTELIVAEADPVHSSRMILPLPALTRGAPINVRCGTEEVKNWRFIDGLAEAEYATQHVVLLPRHRYITTDDDFAVTYRLPYTWDPDPPVLETATIAMIPGTIDVPVTYAAWKMVSARETSRHQIDRAEESTHMAVATGPQLVRLKRDEFYAALDAARRLDPPLRRRRFVSYTSFAGMRF